MISRMRCDGCGNQEVNMTGNSVDYYIELSNVTSSSYGGAVTDMMIYPPIKGGDKHFCGIGCLDKWLRATHPSLYAAQRTSTEEKS